MTFFVDTIDKRNTYVKSFLSNLFDVKPFNEIEKIKKNDVIIFAPNKKFTNEEVENLKNKTTLICGNLPDNQKQLLQAKNIIHKNLLDDEIFAIQNANLTAEGILQNIITLTDKSIFDCKILILGNGRVGKATARLFDKLGLQNVYVNSNDNKNFALSFLFSEKNIFGKKIFDKIDEFDIIINTIPAKYLPNDVIKKIKDNALFLEIASIESVDKNLATNFNYILCPALPQKFSAQTAGKIMTECILRMLK